MPPFLLILYCWAPFSLLIVSPNSRMYRSSRKRYNCTRDAVIWVLSREANPKTPNRAGLMCTCWSRGLGKGRYFSVLPWLRYITLEHFQWRTFQEIGRIIRGCARRCKVGTLQHDPIHESIGRPHSHARGERAISAVGTRCVWQQYIAHVV